jgi:HSP20 family protein
MFDFPSHNLMRPKMAFHPKCDVSENDQAIEIHLEIPGVDKADLSIDISEDNVLSVSGVKESKFEEADAEKQWKRVESMSGSFTRRFQLPKNVKHDDVKAKSSDGVLHVTIQKPTEEIATSSKVEID